MARPRTTGPNIQFRLPLELHERLATRAETGDRTIHAEAAEIVAGVLDHDLLLQSQAEGSLLAAPLCQHNDTSKLSGGLLRCEECHSIRGKDGKWRAAP